MTDTDPLDDVDIQHIKFSSGDEIVSLVSGHDGNNLLLESPMRLDSKMNGPNEVFWFTKWMPLNSTDDITIVNKSNVIASGEVNNDVKEKYLRACLDHRKEEEYEEEEDNIPIEEELQFLNMASPSNKIH